MRNVILLQLPEKPTYTLKNFRRNHMNTPLFGGYICALGKKYFPSYPPLKLFNQDSLDLGGDSFILEHLFRDKPQVLWFPFLSETNFNRSLYLANELKKRIPDIKIIGVGPEVPFNQDNELIKDLDMAIFSREDKTVVEVLSSLFNKEPLPERIRGIIYKTSGKRHVNLLQNNFTAISSTPSPYLLNLLNSVFPYRQVWIETKRGCPHKCSYCYQGSPTISKDSFFLLKRLKEELKFFRQRDIKMVFVLDSTFNYPSKWFYGVANLIKNVNKDKQLTLDCCLRADYLREEDVRLLREGNFTLATVGIQTLNENVLKNIQRKNFIKNWLHGANLILKNKIDLHIHLIMGLPDDTLKSFKYSLDFLAQEGLIQHVIIFSLFLSPVSRMYAEASSLGINFQKSPPHLFLGSSTFSFNEIKEALDYAHQKGCNTILEALSKDSYPQLVTKVCLNYPNSGHSWEFYENLDKKIFQPLTRIIIDLDCNISSKKLYSLARLWSNYLANAMVIWFKGEDLSKKIKLTKDILRFLSLPNPYTVWNIVLESKKPVDMGLVVDEVESAIIYRPHNLDYEGIYFAETADKEYYRCATRFYLIYQLGQKRNSTIKEGIKYHFYCSLKLDKIEGAEKKLKGLMAEDCEGYLLDFENDFSLSEILRSMRFICANNWKKRVVLFRDWQLQCIWDLNFKGGFEIEGEEEHILNLNKDKCIQGKRFSKDLLLPEIRTILDSK